MLWVVVSEMFRGWPWIPREGSRWVKQPHVRTVTEGRVSGVVRNRSQATTLTAIQRALAIPPLFEDLVFGLDCASPSAPTPPLPRLGVALRLQLIASTQPHPQARHSTQQRTRPEKMLRLKGLNTVRLLAAKPAAVSRYATSAPPRPTPVANPVAPTTPIKRPAQPVIQPQPVFKVEPAFSSPLPPPGPPPQHRLRTLGRVNLAVILGTVSFVVWHQ